MKINTLLSRLNKVKRTGDGKYFACCPSHDDRTASLAITDKGDGRILLRCFAECDTYSILKSVGLDWKDILPDSKISHHIKSEKQTIYASDALRIIRFEAQIVCYIAFEIRKNKTLSSDAIDRIEVSMQRINKAMEASNVEN